MATEDACMKSSPDCKWINRFQGQSMVVMVGGFVSLYAYLRNNTGCRTAAMVALLIPISRPGSCQAVGHGCECMRMGTSWGKPNFTKANEKNKTP